MERKDRNKNKMYGPGLEVSSFRLGHSWRFEGVAKFGEGEEHQWDIMTKSQSCKVAIFSRAVDLCSLEIQF